ncbi:C4-dicarboxylate transporter/malic acid transport protein [Candidatus Terasakiella magnetica]|uniref:C4-dicarboxylate transporter/malic acid transport protein n=1 Tax=Candidatus Terasakiella magnetica TaxID=1867952 RepID=A0A1C3RJD0_9PROT|nr:SLAC1 anion channel family protein [Candidatus Terasakiella magnetica]SCA57366.1 C4-dicarboxylate transporter/malic acid transport protein [Candidatus Terasakiella magnetica]
MSEEKQQTSQLQYFPIPMFATTMGLSGLSIISQKLEWVIGGDGLVFTSLAYLTLAIYIAILATYTLKSLKYPAAVLADWNHPIKISFFPAASISLLLLGSAFFPINERLSFFLWSTGCFFQFFLSMAIINSWITHTRYEIVHSTPAWFIPAVGNIIVPVIGVQHAPVELSWFFFAWGLLFWVILLILIMNRLVFHNAMPDKLLPTLFILLAPPSVGFLAYIQLVGDLDTFGRLIYYWAAFFFLLLVFQTHRMVRIKFAMSWWAYTFPLAAFTGATNLMGELTGQVFFLHGAATLYVITFIVIAALVVRTLLALIKCEVCVAD